MSHFLLSEANYLKTNRRFQLIMIPKQVTKHWEPPTLNQYRPPHMSLVTSQYTLKMPQPNQVCQQITETKRL